MTTDEFLNKYCTDKSIDVDIYNGVFKTDSIEESGRFIRDLLSTNNFYLLKVFISLLYKIDTTCNKAMREALIAKKEVIKAVEEHNETLQELIDLKKELIYG